jgi:hypothetical protein
VVAEEAVMSFSVTLGQDVSLLRQRLDRLHADLLTASRQKLTEVARKVGILKASEREKYQLASAVWGPKYEMVRSGTQAWMSSYQVLVKTPEGSWNGQGELLVDAGTRLLNGISELSRNVVNADWLNTYRFLEIAARAGASIPKVTVAAAKYTVGAAGEVIEATGEAVGKGGSAIGRGLAATLAPLKWPLIGVGVLIAIFYLAPVARVAMSARRSSRAS